MGNYSVQCGGDEGKHGAGGHGAKGVFEAKGGMAQTKERREKLQNTWESQESQKGGSRNEGASRNYTPRHRIKPHGQGASQVTEGRGHISEGETEFSSWSRDDVRISHMFRARAL